VNDRLRNQTLALAAAMHCCWLVRQLARQGRVNGDQLECALRPVYELEPGSVDEVYGDGECREHALTVLRAQLGGENGSRDLEVTRYTATIMHLERKLSSRRDLMERLREGIEGARAQLEYFGLTHDNTIARLADVYAQTISSLSPRVTIFNGALQGLVQSQAPGAFGATVTTTITSLSMPGRYPLRARRARACSASCSVR
jgi:high frequency lysogenization protein